MFMSFLNLAPQILSACFLFFFTRLLSLPVLKIIPYLVCSPCISSLAVWFSPFPNSWTCAQSQPCASIQPSLPLPHFFFFFFFVGCRSFLFLSSYQDFALPTAHFLISSVKLCYFNICLCDCICICWTSSP